MERMLAGFQENPILLVIFVACIGWALMGVGPYFKSKKIGKVTCNKCQHVGNLKQTLTSKLVCSNCGSDDWKKA